MTTEQNRAATVVIHCGDLHGGRLERRLRSILETLPASVRAVATVLGTRRLSPSTARRVRVVVVRDGGASLLAQEVTGEHDLVVLPHTALVQPGWFGAVTDRLSASPDIVGVLPLGDAHLFAYPSGITSLDAERAEWDPVPGLSSPAPARRPGQPSLGAVLIVKDEELRLGSCLSALSGVVDELVVYDTGSSDRTKEIAHAHGATVVDGFWDDDFSAARNRALHHSGTTWVLSVDADEVLVGDGGALSQWLTTTRGDAALVRVVSPSTESGTDGDDLRAVRLFRREGARWIGALHEQVTLPDGWTPCPDSPPLHLVHSGYALGHEKAQEKAERNLSIARAAHLATEPGDPQWAEATVAYARALGQAKQYDACIEVMRTVADCGITDGNVVQGARGLIPLLLQRGLLEEASRWTARAAAAGEAAGLTRLREALIQFGQGDYVEAISQLEDLTAGRASGGADLWGRPFDVVLAAVAKADLELSIGLSASAATSMVELMLSNPGRVPVTTLLQSVVSAGGELEELAQHVPDLVVERSLKEAPISVPHLALAWAGALASVRPSDPRPLVAGSVLAARTSIDAALEWSVRAREAGVAGICALRWLAEDGDAHPRLRALAWAVLVHGLGQSGDLELLRSQLALLSSEDETDVLEALRRLVPEAALLRS